MCGSKDVQGLRKAGKRLHAKKAYIRAGVSLFSQVRQDVGRLDCLQAQACAQR